MNTVSLNSPGSKIGKILKAYREKLGLKQSEVSQRAGISTSMLCQIERNSVSPSIDTLCNVCTALGVDIAHLFSSINDKGSVRVLRPGERLKTKTSSAFYEQLAVSVDTAHAGELFLITVEPGHEVGLSGKGHTGAEMGYVLAGSATLIINEKEYMVTQGDSLSFNSELPHRLKNTGTIQFKAIWNALPPHKDYLDINPNS